MTRKHEKVCASISIGIILLEGGWVPLEEKIAALAQAGFDGIDLYMWDMKPFTESLFNVKLSVSNLFDVNFVDEDWELLFKAGEKVNELCTKYGLKVVHLIGLFASEGWPKGSPQAKVAREALLKYSKMLKILGTDMLIVAANTAPDASTDFDLIAYDLGEFADTLKERGQRIAYEFMSWCTAAPTWGPSWEVVKRANRSNLGLCIDTFHIVAYEWADPFSPTGRQEVPGIEEKFAASLKRLSEEVPGDKIFSIQLGDAYKMPVPDPKDLFWPVRMHWAGGFRCKPTTGGGFLPVRQVEDAIFKTGFSGPISIEMFDGSPNGKTPPSGTALEQAQALSESWDKTILGRS